MRAILVLPAAASFYPRPRTTGRKSKGHHVTIIGLFPAPMRCNRADGAVAPDMPPVMNQADLTGPVIRRRPKEAGTGGNHQDRNSSRLRTGGADQPKPKQPEIAGGKTALEVARLIVYQVILQLKHAAEARASAPMR